LAKNPQTPFMRYFTLNIYKSILDKFSAVGYIFSTFEDYISNHKKKTVILRHDVDKLPNNSLRMAELENKLGIKASYYFRIVKESYDENIIRQIRNLGHEVGYHYENLSEISKQKIVKSKQNKKNRNEERGKREEEFRDKLFELAIKDFELNLEKFRKIYPVKTICMHGSPFSKYDNKKIWEKYDYRDFGIIAEPYFDIDYDEVFYITDTGRSWNNSNASLRDKVNSKFDIPIKDTHHLIEKIQNNELPDKIMINVHPQRWNDQGFNWYKELVVQNFKNVIKRYLIKMKDQKA
jgi:hypothetical protein